MLLTQVTMSIEVRGERREIWFFFESHHHDIEDLHAALVEDGSIFGQRIETEPDGPGFRRETRRYDFIVSSEAVVSVCPPMSQLRRVAA
jgi:hypothetical protein